MSGPELDQEYHIWVVTYRGDDGGVGHRVIKSSKKKVTWDMLSFPEKHVVFDEVAYISDLSPFSESSIMSVSYLGYMTCEEFLGSYKEEESD